MQLMPKRIKHRKQQRGKMRGNATRGHVIAFGDFGLQSLGTKWVTARQIETRMGKGKGETKDWVACVKPGTILYEIGGVDEETSKAALRLAAQKMPVRCRFVHRRRTL